MLLETRAQQAAPLRSQILGDVAQFLAPWARQTLAPPVRAGTRWRERSWSAVGAAPGQR